MAKTRLPNTKKTRGAIRKARSKNRKIKDIAARFNVSPSTLSHFISTHCPDLVSKTHPRRVWARERKIAALLKEGKSAEDIARELDLYINTVWRIIRRRIRGFTRGGKLIARRRAIAELAHQRLPVSEIAARLKLGRNTVSTHLKALRLTVPRAGAVELTSRDIEPLLQEGKTFEQIAAHFGVGHMSIGRIVEQYLPEYTKARRSAALRARVKAQWDADVPIKEAAARLALGESTVRKHYRHFAEAINAPTCKSTRAELVAQIGAALAKGHARCRIARDLGKTPGTISRIIKRDYPDHADVELSNCIALGVHRKAGVSDPTTLVELTGLPLLVVERLLRQLSPNSPRMSVRAIYCRRKARTLLAARTPVGEVAKAVQRSEAWVNRLAKEIQQ